MIFSNLRHDNWLSRDNFSNQITDSWWSLSVKRNIRRFNYNYNLFVDLYLFLLHFYIFFWYRCGNILDVYICIYIYEIYKGNRPIEHSRFDSKIIRFHSSYFLYDGQNGTVLVLARAMERSTNLSIIVS